jgi:exonuclease V gamma subunit
MELKVWIKKWQNKKSLSWTNVLRAIKSISFPANDNRRLKIVYKQRKIQKRREHMLFKYYSLPLGGLGSLS